MSYSSSSYFSPVVRETPAPYSSWPGKSPIYEVSLRAASSSDWLCDLQGAYRLVQALLQGRILGCYELLDFLIWPEGLLARVELNGSQSLSEFLRFLKEKSSTAGKPVSESWDDELRWLRLVHPGRLYESTVSFQQTVEQVRQESRRADGALPPLFFYYRNSRYGQGPPPGG